MSLTPEQIAQLRGEAGLSSTPSSQGSEDIIAKRKQALGIVDVPEKSFLDKSAGILTSLGGKRIGEAIGTQAAKLMVKPEERQYISPGPTGMQLAGDILQVGSTFAPMGAISKSLGIGAKAIGLGKLAEPLANIATGAGVGYGIDVGSKLAEGKTGTEALTPGLGTAIGGAIPAVAPVSKGVAKIGGEVLGKTTGAGFGTIKEGLIAASEGGKKAEAFKSALRGNTNPEKLVEEARSSLDQIVAERRGVYQKGLEEIAGSNQIIDTSPIVEEVGKQLEKFNVGVLEDGTLDFSRSSLRFNKQAQNDIQTIVSEMQGFGSREGDNTALGVDNLKRAFGDLYTPSGEARAFIQAVKSKTRGLLSEVPGYDETMGNYEDKTELIDEIRKGLSLGDKSQTDTAFRKLTSALRLNNEFRKELVKELDEATGGELLAKVAGQQLSEVLPRGLVGPVGAIGGAGALMTGIGLAKLIPATMAFSPRLVGEFINALGFTGSKATEALKIIEKNIGKVKFPGDVILDKVNP